MARTPRAGAPPERGQGTGRASPRACGSPPPNSPGVGRSSGTEGRPREAGALGGGGAARTGAGAAAAPAPPAGSGSSRAPPAAPAGRIPAPTTDGAVGQRGLSPGGRLGAPSPDGSSWPNPRQVMDLPRHVVHARPQPPSVRGPAQILGPPLNLLGRRSDPSRGPARRRPVARPDGAPRKSNGSSGPRPSRVVASFTVSFSRAIRPRMAVSAPAALPRQRITKSSASLTRCASGRLRAGVRLGHAPATWGFPCCGRPPYADRPPPRPRRERRRGRVAARTAPAAAAPRGPRGRLPHESLRGRRGVHTRCGLPARGGAGTAPAPRGFGKIVASPNTPMATGWSNSCQVGIAPTEERRLSRRTDISDFLQKPEMSSFSGSE